MRPFKLKAPKRPAIDSKGRAVRHIARNTYNRCPIDAFLKFMYRYSFHLFCTKFTIIIDRDKHTILPKNFVGYSTILEVVNYIYNETYEYTEGDEEKYAGLPILESGVVCYFNPEDPEDPEFTCTITLTKNFRTPDKPKVKVSEVISFGK